VVRPGGRGGGLRPDLADRDRTRVAVGGRVDQHDERRPADIGGQLGGELVAGQDLGIREPGVGGQQAGGVPADPVVGAQGVAVADDQDAGAGPRLRSSSTAPSGASSCTCKGICPMAWVEQLRQGS
jgi:hypothetical protein